MNTNYVCQSHQSKKNGSLAGVIGNWPNIERCQVIRVAVAYATVSGVQLLLSSIASDQLKESYWLVGLDDAITQPGAIEMLQQEVGANVRVASYQSKGFRFHPKVFQFGFDLQLKNSVLVVGSNNLTSSAMRGNGEAFVTVHPTSSAELNAAEKFWEQLWGQGHEPSPAELSAYKLRYEKAKRVRKKLERVLGVKQSRPVVQEVLSSDEAEIDAALSSTCWIECGAVTAMGRELEFKAEQGRFFKLSPFGGDAKDFKFRVSDGKTISLRMKYQQNHMWRLQMNKDVPEVRTGLRPLMPDGSLGRSPYVAVFKRTKLPGTYDLQFVKLTSPTFSRLKDESQRRGTVGRTSARQYGWC